MRRRARLAAPGWLVAAACLGAGPATADWTASGRFEYTDRLYDASQFTGTTPAPVREADVQVFDRNTEAVLASGATDGSGDFSILVPDASVRDVAVRVLASGSQTGSLVHRVVDDRSGNAVYTYRDPAADVVGHAPTVDVDFGTMTMPAAIGPVGSTDWSSQIFNAYDMGVRLADWVASLDGARPGVAYDVLFNPNNGRSGSFYSPSSNELSLADDDGYDDPNILHEMGHYVEDEFGFSQSPGGSHTISDLDQDPRLAWSEGWATLASNATLEFHGLPRPDLYSDRDSFGASGFGGFSYSVEPVVAWGATNERAVNATLWDLVDAAGSADDSPGVDDDVLAGRGTDLWTVLEEMRVRALAGTQMEDFWDLWLDLALGDLPDLEDLLADHRMDFAPDAQEPNDAPATAAALVVDGPFLESTFYRSGPVAGGDEDWFAFQAVAGTWYRVEVDGTMFGRPDPELALLGPDLDQLQAASDDPRDLVLNDEDSSSAQDMDETAPELLWRAPASGTYHVLVRHASYPRNLTGRYGTYSLRVRSVSTPTPSIDQVAVQRMRPGQTYPLLVLGSDFATDAEVTTDAPNAVVSGIEVLAPGMLVADLAPDGATPNGNYDLTVTNPGGGADSWFGVLVVNAGAEPPLLLSEVDSGAPDAVEVRNAGSVVADLTGWSLSGFRPGFSTATYVFPSFSLAPGNTVVVRESSGTDTASDLYGGFNWFWFHGDTGAVSLIDDLGNNVDYLRWVRSPVTTHEDPLGIGGGWTQPEFQSPEFPLSVARDPAGRPRTRRGLGPAQLTMPVGFAGRENHVDRHEDDDAPRRAPVHAGSLSLPDLAISPRAGGTDEDWFGFVVRAGDALDVGIQFSHAQGDLDLALFAPGEESTPLLASTSTSDDEAVSLTSAQSAATGSGLYRLRVSGAAGATNAYALDAVETAGPCRNGVDDDGDGFTDFGSDPGCTSEDDPAETDAGLACDDGLDNDLDGGTDLADIGCRTPDWPTESPKCSDGINNDPGQDALIDWDGGASAGVPPAQQTDPDPDCKGDPTRKTETKGTRCGIGFELVALALPFARLRRARRIRPLPVGRR